MTALINNDSENNDGVVRPQNDNFKARSVAIMIGNVSSRNSDNNTVPVVVWVDQERTTRDSPTDPWKHTLEYYEFYDDTARWTHLDQLLLRFGTSTIGSLHVGAAEGLGNNKSNGGDGAPTGKKRRIDRLVGCLQAFLDERERSESEHENVAENETSCHLHLNVPVDASKIEASLSQLLLEDPDVQLAVRGNLQISRGLIQHGLALWLQAEGLLSASGGSVGDSWAHSCKVQQGVLTSHLVMDRTAAQCIHLLPPANAGVATVVGGTVHNNSLWGVLSKPCLTQLGKQKVGLWLRQPLIDLAQIMERQQAVADLTGLPKDSIRDALKPFSGMDLGKLAQTLENYLADENPDGDGAEVQVHSTKKALQALYQLYLLASQKLPQLVEAATSAVGDNTTSQLLRDAQINLVKLVGELERCQGLVEAVLDLDQAPREYLLKPNFSPELQDLYEEMQSVQQSVDEELDQMQNVWADLGGKSGQVRLEQPDESSGWQFRLPNTNDMKTLQTLGSKIQTHRILKNGVYFSTLELRQLSAKYQEIVAEYNNKSRQVVKDAMSVATTYHTVVGRVAEWVSTLDVLCGLAHMADFNSNGYCRPTVTDSDEDGAGIVLTEARHPCVELQDIDFIPNDISLIFGASNFLLVTGPNMGGKSTYIRALGAIVCMAQIGSYVPCKSARINICHSILARVGAGDLQERGISTFMAEMLEASSILRTATKRSLIIIDELGRGTSTFDGYGLARAISEYLMQRIGCCVVFATHFHELTALPGVQNCHVTAQKGDQGLTFLYSVRPGPCLESFGIQVAEMANVPACVIEDAKRKAAELENFGNSNKRARSSDGQFLERFKCLDLPSFLRKDISDDEKRTELLQLLATPDFECV